MVTNFDYLKNESKFSAFANVAISAEKIILADPDASILNTPAHRRWSAPLCILWKTVCRFRTRIIFIL